MKIVCSGCGAQHCLSDMQLAGGGCNVVCPRCSTSIYADASMVDPQSLEPRWYYACDNDSVGPISTRDLEFALQNGQISLESYVWCEGMSDWMSLGSVPEFEYLHSIVHADGGVDGESETRVADVAAIGVSSFESFESDDDMRTCAGEETAAIDIAELEKNGSYEFGGAASASVEEEPSFNNVSEQEEPNANDVLGAPSENSVLFSLSSLQAVAPASPAEVASVAEPGLNVNTVSKSSSARRRTNEIVDSFGGSSVPAATVLPLGTKKDNKPIIIAIALIGVVLVGVIIALVVFMSGSKNDTPVQSAKLDESMVAANELGVSPSAAAKAKAEEEKRAAEEAERQKLEEQKKALEEAQAKLEAEKAAMAEAEAKAKAEAEAEAKAKEEAEAEEAKKAAEKKSTKSASKSESKKSTAKTETKKAETSKKTETKAAASAASGLSKADIQSAFRSVSGDIRTCSRTSTTKGKMNISFTIKANGSVSGAKVTTAEFAGTPTATCVLKVVNKMKFKAPGSDTPISNYPIAIQ